MISNTFHLDAALTWYDQGFCVMPARFDGSKRPRFEWKEFQGTRPNRGSVERWYIQEPELGVGLICGNVSGGLEMTELEGDFTSSEKLDKLRAECDRLHITWLWDLLTIDGYAEWTPSGGIHTLYRISDNPVPKNKKIAMDVTAKITYAETRGEGGFVIVAPTSGTVHQTGDAWVLAAGDIGQVPVITWDDRELLHAAIKAAFDERVPYVAPIVERRPLRERAVGEISPQDDFNERGDWHEILSSRGWTHHSRTSSQEFWTRPGKDPRDGHSAATGHQGSPNLYVWSGMDDERHYSKAQFVAYSDFNGDFAALTKQLAREGFGTPLPARDIQAQYRSQEIAIPAGRDIGFDEAVAAAQATETEPAKKPEPRMAEWTHVGAGRFAAQLHRDQFHEIYEEKGNRAYDAGWRVYEDGAWSEDLTKQVARAMETVSDKIQRQAEGQLAKAEAAFAHEATDENKKYVKMAEKNLTFARGCASDAGQKAITNRYSVQKGVARSIKEFDTRQELLCLANGTFDLDAMSLRDHSPADLLTRRMPFAYDSDATCPLWEQAMEGWIPDKEVRDYVQRALGYTLLGKVQEGVFFVPWGETGCGKSQFVETLTALFGDFGKTAEASTFRDKSFTASESTNNIHDLRGKRFVASSETSKGAGLNEELVKRATGEDALTTRALYQNNITWKPQFVLWMATNFKPNLSSEDSAIWRRVKPIHFPNSFYDSDARIKGLGSRLIDEELAGIFNWLLEGVRKYREFGLEEPESMTQAIADYRDEQDPVAAFLAEAEADGKIELVADAECESSKIFNVYANYCAQNNLKPITPTRFGRILSDRKFETRRGTNGVKLRKGIKIVWIAETSPPAWSPGFRN